MTEQPQRSPSFIGSEAAATDMAVAVMSRLGFADARPAADARATGLSVVAERAVARVAFSGQVNMSDLQRLGAVHELDPDMALLAFSASGYSDATRAFAESTGIALFVYDPLGRVYAVNDHAVPYERLLKAHAEEGANLQP